MAGSDPDRAKPSRAMLDARSGSPRSRYSRCPGIMQPAFTSRKKQELRPDLYDAGLGAALHSGSLRLLYFGVGSPPESIMLDCSDSLHTHSVDEGGVGAMDLGSNAAFDQKRLSKRELAIIALIGEGRTNNAIAVQLGIAPETIKTYLKRIFVKLGTHSRAEAVVLAQRASRCPSTPASPARFSLDTPVGDAVQP
jgi:DNA-binding CsgD family transcriptional regulator